MSEKQEYEMTPIEKEFSDIIEKLNEKLKVAANAMKEVNLFCEANDLSLKLNDGFAWCKGKKLTDEEKDNLYEMMYNKVATHQFMNELENAGWNTSSMSC